jgi:hypothetical protein
VRSRTGLMSSGRKYTVLSPKHQGKGRSENSQHWILARNVFVSTTLTLLLYRPNPGRTVQANYSCRLASISA